MSIKELVEEYKMLVERQNAIFERKDEVLDALFKYNFSWRDIAMVDAIAGIKMLKKEIPNASLARCDEIVRAFIKSQFAERGEA